MPLFSCFILIFKHPYSHSIVSRKDIALFLRTFSKGAKQTTDISSVAHFRLPANVGGCPQKRIANGVIDIKSLYAFCLHCAYRLTAIVLGGVKARFAFTFDAACARWPAKGVGTRGFVLAQRRAVRRRRGPNAGLLLMVIMSEQPSGALLSHAPAAWKVWSRDRYRRTRDRRALR
jgi:hypothetical protein